MVVTKSIFASWCSESSSALPGEDVFGETPNTARETHALPGTEQHMASFLIETL
jgi:hypothetical protein